MEDDVRPQPCGERLERLVADVELVELRRRRDVLPRAGGEVVDDVHLVASRASSASTTCEPMKPAPPVTIARIGRNRRRPGSRNRPHRRSVHTQHTFFLHDVSEHLLQHLPCPSRLFFAVEEVGVDAEGDLAGGVAELAGDEGDVCAAGDEEAGEGVPKVVPPDRLEPGSLESGLQRSQADVRCMVWRPGSRREHVVVGLVESCLPSCAGGAPPRARA